MPPSSAAARASAASSAASSVTSQAMRRPVARSRLEIQQRDARAGLLQQARARSPDTATASCHDCRLAVEPEQIIHGRVSILARTCTISSSATPCCSTASAARRARRSRRGRRPHRRARARPRAGARNARRAGARADAGHRRQPHPLRRPDHLGPAARAEPGAGRHQRGDRQLRLHHRALPPGRARARDAQPDAGRGHGARGAARRDPLGVRDRARVPRHARAPRRGAQRGGLRRPFGGAQLRDGRSGHRARRERRRDRRHAPHRARGRARRRGRLFHQHLAGAQRRGRRADALAPGR